MTRHPLPTGIETREVLADAHRRSGQQYLRHAIEVDPRSGRELRPVCNKIELGSLADRGAGDPAEWPTCLICLRRVIRKSQGKPLVGPQGRKPRGRR